MALFRVDRISKKGSFAKIRTEKNTRRGEIILAVAEHPLTYSDKKGKRVEVLPERELLNTDSLASTYGLPILYNHPINLYYNNNEENLLIGHTLETYIKEDKSLLIPYVIDDSRGIKLIDSVLAKGKSPEISPAYTLSELLQREDGVYEQIGREYDHVAIGIDGWGRGGQKLSLRTDSSDDVLIEEELKQYFIFDSKEENIPKNHKLSILNFQNMKTIKINNIEYEVPPEVAGHLESLSGRVDALNAAKDAAEGKLKATQLQLDAASNKTNDAEIAETIKERVDCWNIVLPSFRKDKSDFEPDYTMSASEIKKSYLLKTHPDIKLDNKSSDYISALWDVLKPDNKTIEDPSISRVDALLNQFKAPPQTQTLNSDSNNQETAEEKATREHVEKIANNYKKK